VKASEFEYRFQRVLHQALVGAGLATYLLDPVDVVWRFIRESPNRRVLEHVFFAMAALLVGTGAALATWASAHRECTGNGSSLRRRCESARYAGSLLFSLGLSSLLPLAGCLILVVGEAVRVFRLAQRLRSGGDQSALWTIAQPEPRSIQPDWTSGVREQSGRWGIFLTMIVFSITLVDRHADYGVLASVLLWICLNYAQTYHSARQLCLAHPK
jgi:hypothetical protein